jgi:hypothetical protein
VLLSPGLDSRAPPSHWEKGPTQGITLLSVEASTIMAKFGHQKIEFNPWSPSRTSEATKGSGAPNEILT